jgi:hypothetical protein
MSRAWCTVFGAVALGFFLQTSAAAQGMALESDPPGAYVQIRGPVSLSGTAPVPLAELPLGEYGLMCSGPGRVSLRGRFVRSDAGLVGRSWAGVSALVHPPGLQHLRSADDRGWVFLGAGIVSATLTAAEEAAHQSAETDREKAYRSYAGAVSSEAILEARGRMLDAIQEKQDRREVRNLWLGYLAAAWIGAGVEAWLLTPEPILEAGNAGQYVVSVPGAGGIQAGWRSLLVPGAGQRYVGRSGRGDFFLAATAVLGAGAIGAQETFLEARRDQAAAQRWFDEAQTTEAVGPARDRLQRAANRADDRNALRWALVGAAAGAYLWNVLDAFGSNGRFDDIPELGWSVAPSPDGGGYVCATWSVR